MFLRGVKKNSFWINQKKTYLNLFLGQKRGDFGAFENFGFQKIFVAPPFRGGEKKLGAQKRALYLEGGALPCLKKQKVS